MFDGDGVLFDAHDPNVKLPSITEFIIGRLIKGEPVTINSGRGVNFALEKLLPSLKERGITIELLDHMIVVGQKGAEVGRFIDGELVIEIDEEMTVPDSLRESVFDLIRSQFADSMFEGEIKPTMLSPQRRGIEQGREVPHEEFYKEQERLVPVLRELLERYHLEDTFKIDATNIATDIESKQAGKDLGARKIMEWMGEKKLFPQEFQAFGDSPSDRDMADEIHKQGYPVEFVWVGKKGGISPGDVGYPVIIPDGEHDEATANYFRDFLMVESQQ